MRLSLRPYMTTGVAIVGVSVIAVTPITAPPPDVQVSAVERSSAAVQLSAFSGTLPDPVSPWLDLFGTSADNIAVLAETILADPAPVLRQIGTNWVGYANLVTDGLQFTALSYYLANTLPNQVQLVQDRFAAGDIGGAAQAISNIILQTQLNTLISFFGMATIPGTITQNLANVAGNVMGIMQPLVTSPTWALQAAITATGQSIEDFVATIDEGDPTATLNALARIPADAVGGLLNGFQSPDNNFLYYPGLLSPPSGYFNNAGFFYNLAKTPQLIAQLIGAAPATLQSPQELSEGAEQVESLAADEASRSAGFNALAEIGAVPRSIADSLVRQRVSSAAEGSEAAEVIDQSVDGDDAVDVGMDTAVPDDVSASPSDSDVEEVTPRNAGTKLAKTVSEPVSSTISKVRTELKSRLDTAKADQEKRASGATARDRISSTVSKVRDGIKSGLSKPGKKDSESKSDSKAKSDSKSSASSSGKGSSDSGGSDSDKD